jgi:phage portal protein BeeE
MVATQESWVNARRAKNGAVAVTPANVEVIDHGSSADANLYIEGRNSSRMDIASFFNLPGAILDASQAQASLTYVTEQNTRSSVYDLTLPYWVRPIESRFSQDDVVPRGQRVAFDFSTLAPTAPGPVSED